MFVLSLVSGGGRIDAGCAHSSVLVAIDCVRNWLTLLACGPIVVETFGSTQLLVLLAGLRGRKEATGGGRRPLPPGLLPKTKEEIGIFSRVNTSYLYHSHHIIHSSDLSNLAVDLNLHLVLSCEDQKNKLLLLLTRAT